MVLLLYCFIAFFWCVVVAPVELNWIDWMNIELSNYADAEHDGAELWLGGTVARDGAELWSAELWARN